MPHGFGQVHGSPVFYLKIDWSQYEGCMYPLSSELSSCATGAEGGDVITLLPSRLDLHDDQTKLEGLRDSAGRRASSATAGYLRR